MSSPATLQNSSSSTLFLPYGYKIDLDFIKYCENLNNIDPTDAELQRRNRRRQRQSMEVMLGIQLEMQQQINEASEIWDKKAPEPPPRTHLHPIESPIVPKLTARQNADTKWDPALSEVVNDFERTLERSKKEKVKARSKSRSKEDLLNDNCIPFTNHEKPPSRPPLPHQDNLNHVSIESIDGSLLMQQNGDDNFYKKRIFDLEEQTKLIPLLQMQIQSLKDEQKQLLLQLEANRATSSSSSSSSSSPPQQHTHFQIHRVSPVSLSSMKLNTNVLTKRTIGTNTGVIYHRDIGTGCEKKVLINSTTMTDFRLSTDGDGGRLYSEKDLKKTVELVHAKMRRAMVSVGIQHAEQKSTRNVGIETTISTSEAACCTDGPSLVVAPMKVINIDPLAVPSEPQQLLSLKDMGKLPAVRNSMTQTTQGAVHHQTVQATPYGSNKGTDSIDLIKTINRATGTDMIYKKDQIIATDSIRMQNSGTNTAAEPKVTTKTTSSNTDRVAVATIGVNYEPVLELSSSSGSMTSKIPRPSPNVQRKFNRQDTFTVNAVAPVSLTAITTTTVIKSPKAVGNPSSLFEFRKTPERVERITEPEECPVERVLKLTMNHQRSPSPVQKVSTISHEEEVNEQQVDEPVTHREEEDPVDMPASKLPMSPSIEYLDDDEDEDEDDFEDDEFNDEQLPSSMPMRPPPTSISTIRLVQEGRVRIKPSKEMISALKVINDHLEKHPEPIESQIVSAREVAACEWFQISSTEKANPDNVEDYLDYFEEQSWDLLEFMVNLKDKNGNMAMHYAVSHGNFDVVSILLDSKVCHINQTNNAGYTCTMLVSLAKLFISEHRTVVKRLFKLSDVNIRATKNSQTALMLAVSHGNFEIVQMMVEAGADINIQDDDGSTALMCAAEQGHLDIIKFLLAQPDCDSTKQDVDGNTALKISLEAGYHDIGCLLYAHEHLIRSKSTVKRTPSRKSSTSSLT